MLSVMSGSAPLPSHVEQLEAFQKQDAARYTFIAEIVQKYEELQVKYQEKCDDYNNEVESRRMWQSKASSSERALTEQKQVSVSSRIIFIEPIICDDKLVANLLLTAYRARIHLFFVFSMEMEQSYVE